MIRLNRTKNSTLDMFFILILLALFLAISFFVIFIGAKQYHSIADRITENYQIRTASSYLNEHFNWDDRSVMISVIDLDGIPAIVSETNPSDPYYDTYIYVYDGYLRELTVSKDTAIFPDSGEKIVKLASLTIEAYSSHLYCFTLTDTYGNVCPVYISRNAT